MPLVTTIARACPPILLRAQHLLVEVIDDDLGLEVDGVIMLTRRSGAVFLRFLGVELGSPSDRLDQVVVTVAPGV